MSHKSSLIFFAVLAMVTISQGVFEFNQDSTNSISQQNSAKLKEITEDKINSAIESAIDSIKKQKRFEERISSSRVKVLNGGISHAQLIDGLPTTQANNYDKVAQTILKSSLNLLHSECRIQNIADDECAKYISDLQLPNGPTRDACLNVVRNVENSYCLHPYRRLIPADYKDGIYKQKSSTGQNKLPLPLPRDITSKFFQFTNQENSSSSAEMFSDEGVLDLERNVALTQWAQFIEQDLVKTVQRVMDNGDSIECCNDIFNSAPPRFTHPACDPLQILQTDNFYHKMRITCLNYVRSALAVNEECKFGPAEQLNQASNIFDLSNLYGINEEKTKNLRTMKHGLLKTSKQMTLPLNENSKHCLHHGPNETCYKSGDTRVNINPYVTTLYTLFLRSHNKIAKKLRHLNEHWMDEQIFQTTRKINSGLYQKIVYEEWLPVVLGENVGNQINSEKFTKKNIPNGVSNEFATAGIRFYNSMMPGDLITTSRIWSFETNYLRAAQVLETSEEIIKLQDLFYRPKDLSQPGQLETILKAVLKQNAMAMDSSIVDDLSMQLYRCPHRNLDFFGTDVLALDILRARDHGIPSYKKYAQKCLNRRISDWRDLIGIVREQDLHQLKEIYKSVDAVDLIMGLISEIPVNGATVGPTSVCIIGEQLSNSRQVDPNFYRRSSDTNDKVLQTIQSYTGAKLMCDTTNLQNIQKNLFLVPSEKNPFFDCSDSSLGKLNLNIWKEIF